MKKADTLKGSSDEALVAELQRRAPQLPDSLKQQLTAALAEKTRPQLEGALSAAAENAIQAYGQQYDSLPDGDKSRCDWKTVSARLLANGSEKLKLAEAMQGGGELVGIDAEGKAMFKDKGVEPVMYGYDEKDKLVQIYDRDPKQMAKVKNEKWANYFETREQVLKDGYELFADDGNYNLSDEMRQVQAHTKEPFVASKDRKEWRASWLESGGRPVDARSVNFDPDGGLVYVFEYNPEFRYGNLGVARLLRV